MSDEKVEKVMEELGRRFQKILKKQTKEKTLMRYKVNKAAEIFEMRHKETISNFLLKRGIVCENLLDIFRQCPSTALFFDERQKFFYVTLVDNEDDDEEDQKSLGTKERCRRGLYAGTRTDLAEGIDQPPSLCPVIRDSSVFEVDFGVFLPNDQKYQNRKIQNFEDVFDSTFQLIRNNIKEMGITKMTRFQAAAIPAMTSSTFNFFLNAPPSNGTSMALCSAAVLKLSKRTGGCTVVILTSTMNKAKELGILMKYLYKNAFEFYLSDGNSPGPISQEIYVADIATFAEDVKNSKLVTNYSTFLAVKDIKEDQFNIYQEYLRLDSPYFAVSNPQRIFCTHVDTPEIRSLFTRFAGDFKNAVKVEPNVC